MLLSHTYVRAQSLILITSSPFTDHNSITHNTNSLDTSTALSGYLIHSIHSYISPGMLRPLPPSPTPSKPKVRPKPPPNPPLLIFRYINPPS